MNRVDKMKSKFIMVCGVAASGKTRLARELVRTYDAFYLDKDDLQNAFTEQRKGEFYKSIVDGSYRAMYNICSSNLKLGKNVILVAPHVVHMKDESWIEKISRMAEESHSDIKVVWCYADKGTIRKRLEERGYERDEDKLRHFEEFLEREPLRLNIPFDHIEVDTSEEYNVSNIVKFLKGVN